MHIHVGVFGCFHDVVAGKAWLKDMAGCMKGRPLGAGRDVFKVEKFWDGLGWLSLHRLICPLPPIFIYFLSNRILS